MAGNNPITESYWIREAARQQALIKEAAKNLDEINRRQQREAQAKEDQKAEAQREEFKSREKIAQSACESFRKAITLDPEAKVTIAEAVISSTEEAQLIEPVSPPLKDTFPDPIAAKVGEEVNFASHFLGSQDGEVFKEGDCQFWGDMSLLSDFKYYCVTRRKHDSTFLIIDKVEHKRDDLGEFLLLAKNLSTSEILKKKCEQLISLWETRKKEKEAELQKIVSILPRIKSDFHKRRAIKLAAIAVGILALWLGPTLLARMRGTAPAIQEDTSSPKTVIETILKASRANNLERLMECLNVEKYRPADASDESWEATKKEIGRGFVKDGNMLSSLEKILTDNGTRIKEISIDKDKKKLVAGSTEILFMRSNGKWQMVF